jgi:hypothetical protein
MQTTITNNCQCAKNEESTEAFLIEGDISENSSFTESNTTVNSIAPLEWPFENSRATTNFKYIEKLEE